MLKFDLICLHESKMLWNKETTPESQQLVQISEMMNMNDDKNHKWLGEAKAARSPLIHGYKVRIMFVIER